MCCALCHRHAPGPAPDDRPCANLSSTRHALEAKASQGPAGTCFAVEDKGPDAIWRGNGLFWLAPSVAVYDMPSRAPDRWRVGDAAVDAVVSWCPLLCDCAIPKSMRAKG
eukprot:3316081-Pyramimonas_sp.AAC.1